MVGVCVWGGEAATWPRAKMQALSNGLTSGGFEGTVGPIWDQMGHSSESHSL